MNQITSLKKYKLLLEKKKDPSSDLIIVDVQPDFIKFFNDKYIQELKKYCYQFGRVFNISDTTDSDKFYTFPGQVTLFEKQYGRELTLEECQYYFIQEICEEIEKEWDIKEPGWHKETTNGDLWLYVGSQHGWIYVNKDLYKFVKDLSKTNRKVTIVGGAGDINGNHDTDGECLTDIIVLLNTFNINYTIDDLYVYTYKGCKFKKDVIKEHMTYHLDNNIKITENIFRVESPAFFNLIKGGRQLYNENKLVNDIDKDLYKNTNIGLTALYENKEVYLDLPLEYINEAEYKGREVELNKPKRGGIKKFYVYVKDGDKVKKIQFGDTSGLNVKISDPEARKSFAARHQCHLKNDKTTAGYWSCRINRYAYLFNGVTYPGFW